MSLNDVEAVDAEVESVAIAPAKESGLSLVTSRSYPLAAMSPEEFSGLLDAMTTHHERMQEVQRKLLRYGVHYGLPGVSEEDWRKETKDKGTSARKPGLMKPGAERLLALHRYVATTEASVVYGDPENKTSPAISVRTSCFVHADSLNGPVVGMGIGACNSWETKYRWRDQSRFCPVCHKPAIIKGREEYGGGWVCFGKKGGCGAKFRDGDETIEAQMSGRVPNEEAHDLENTLLKMAEKRAKVDATLAATNTSDLFTQDVEDMPQQEPEGQSGKKPEASQRPTKARAVADANGNMNDGQRNAIERLMQEKRGIKPEEIGNAIASWPFITAAEAGRHIAELQKD